MNKKPKHLVFANIHAMENAFGFKTKSEAAAGGLAFQIRVGTQLIRAPRYPPPGALCSHKGAYRLVHVAIHVLIHLDYRQVMLVVG